MNKKAQIAIIAITALLLGLLLMYAGILQGKLVIPERPGSAHRHDRETTQPQNTTAGTEDVTEPEETEETTERQEETKPVRNPNQGAAVNPPTAPPATNPPETTPPTLPPTEPPTAPPVTAPPETEPVDPTEDSGLREDEFPTVPLG